MDYVKWDGQDIVAKLEGVIGEQLTTTANKILAEAKDNAPEDTGNLKATARVKVYSDEAQIVFPAPYAMYVHENLNATHTKGHAKYLEQALYSSSFVVDLTKKIGEHL